MQKVKMSWGQRDGYGPGNGEGREGFLEGVCMCLCVCVCMSVRINPRLEVGLAGDIWLRRLVNNFGASHVPGHTFACVIFLPPPVLTTALRIYYSLHSADENIDVQRRRPQGSEGKEREFKLTSISKPLFLCVFFFLLLKF